MSPKLFRSGCSVYSSTSLRRREHSERSANPRTIGSSLTHSLLRNDAKKFHEFRSESGVERSRDFVVMEGKEVKADL